MEEILIISGETTTINTEYTTVLVQQTFEMPEWYYIWTIAHLNQLAVRWSPNNLHLLKDQLHS